MPAFVPFNPLATELHEFALMAKVVPVPLFPDYPGRARVPARGARTGRSNDYRPFWYVSDMIFPTSRFWESEIRPNGF